MIIGTIIADPNVSIIDFINSNIKTLLYIYIYSLLIVLITSSKKSASPIPVKHANAFIVGNP